MKKGVVLFAFNNTLDYIKLAKDVAIRVNQYLNLPTTLITDSKISDNVFHNIIYVEDTSTNYKTFHDVNHSEKLLWRNTNRSEIYNLSPYDETLVLDVDYVIQSEFLKNCFLINKDLLLYKDNFHLSGQQFSEFNYLNSFSVPFYWATVFYFKKTKLNELFFNHITFIKNNWNYYKDLYQIVNNQFRNDFAFSIAIHTFNGYCVDGFNGKIPGKLNFITDKDRLVKIGKNFCVFDIADSTESNSFKTIVTKDTDVHVMNKYSLLRCLT